MSKVFSLPESESASAAVAELNKAGRRAIPLTGCLPVKFGKWDGELSEVKQFDGARLTNLMEDLAGAGMQPVVKSYFLTQRALESQTFTESFSDEEIERVLIEMGGLVTHIWKRRAIIEFVKTCENVQHLDHVKDAQIGIEDMANLWVGTDVADHFPFVPVPQIVGLERRCNTEGRVIEPYTTSGGPPYAQLLKPDYVNAVFGEALVFDPGTFEFLVRSEDPENYVGDFKLLSGAEVWFYQEQWKVRKGYMDYEKDEYIFTETEEEHKRRLQGPLPFADHPKDAEILYLRCTIIAATKPVDPSRGKVIYYRR